ncbi:MAG: sulfatase-like hydrolase/transferase [Rikenellaceae bacterium]
MMKLPILVASGALCSSSLFSQTSRPNIVFILADDMRGSTIELLGKESVLTPNLNRLAADGVVFTNAHIMGGTSGAVSMPSRAMLLTGKYLHHLSKNGAVIPSSHTTIGESLREVGYQTYHIGKWHSDYASFNRCFSDGKDIFFGGMADHWNVPLYNYDSSARYGKKRPVITEWNRSNKIDYKDGEYIYSGKHSVDIFTDAAIDFLTEQKDKSDPFFLYVAYMSPHDPRSMPEKYLQQYDSALVQLPENFKKKHPFDNGELVIRDESLAALPRVESEVKEHIRSYYAMITHLDDNIGRLIQTLKEQGMYENTMIVFAADNGLAVGQHGLMGKQNVYEHSVSVPLIIRHGGVAAGSKTDKLCYLIDIFPTLCQVAGASKPSSVDGVSLMPVIEDDKSVRDYLYYGYRDFQRAVSDGEWKLIEYHVKGDRTTQLFNLKNDPMEITDLSSDKKYTSLIKRLRAEMLKQKELTDDNSPFWN